MYYFAADGGGNKLTAIVYDDEFNIVSRDVGGATNPLYRTQESISAELERMSAKLLDGVGEIESADICISGDVSAFDAALNKYAQIKRFRHNDSGAVMMAAACGKTNGIVTYSGTGSVSYLLEPGIHDAIGGWGDILGDEGSGSYIGMKALNAAIWSYDGRGMKTSLEQIIKREWRLHHMYELTSRVYTDVDRRRRLASAALLCAEAARAGDTVAVNIYTHAAHHLAHLTNTLLDRRNGLGRNNIVVSGGAWKGPDLMFDTFCEDIRKKYPDAVISRPAFEPVIGNVILRLLYEGRRKSDFWDAVTSKFADYLYTKERENANDQG
ncbi:MAG: hypothetical protein K6D94_07150 [Clostridiales bacterium]|nr:hypothetical protein [Clostridiales bacterium]